MKIVFIGTPEFGAVILEELAKTDYRPALVITETDKPKGRKQIITPPPVKIVAEKYGISVLQPEKIINCKNEIEKLRPDLIIVAAYGQILPKEILEIPKYRSINVHPSLLPKYRGPSPVQNAILNGDKETGATIMLMDEKMDHGPILTQKKVPIEINENAIQLHEKLAKIGAKLLINTIPSWVTGAIKQIIQDEKMATYTKIIKKEDGKIDWKKPAKEIDRQIRAFDDWPGSYTFFKNGDNLIRLKIIKAGVLAQTQHGPFGVPGKTFMATNEEIAVQTGKDYLIIKELQPEGKRKKAAKEFLKGHTKFIGIIFE
ncbi:MAG: methionyl-tRNA formyltransferase [Candidatus Pacebacteria bacterium]|nr:methionyl-tRNA formyltransferase [Candidatus Paceibacterota bacterium]